MLPLNKIRKYHKKKKRVKKNRKDPRSSYIKILEPCKFINPYTTYRLHGDMVIQELDGIRIPGFSSLNLFKIVGSVEDNKVLGTITVNLGEAMNNPTLPWQYIVERLKSKSNTEDLQWAESIETYSLEREKCMALMANPEDKKCYKTPVFPQCKSKYSKESLVANFPTMCTKFLVTDKTMKRTQLIYNEKLLTLLGYTFPYFCSLLLRKGVPDLAPASTDHVKDWLRRFLKAPFMKDLPNDMQNVEVELLMRDWRLKGFQYSIFYFPNFNPRKGLELDAVVVYKEVPMQPLANAPKEYQNMKFEEYQTEYEKDVDDFLRKFYNQTYQGLFKNVDKVCGFKELPDLKMEVETQQTGLFDSMEMDSESSS
jgi:hypothetical protein